jgi:hypothetical protein
MSTVRRLSAVWRRGLIHPVLAGTASAPTPSIAPATPTAIPTPAPTPDLTARAAAAYLTSATTINAASGRLRKTVVEART